MVIFNSYVKLPEGIYGNSGKIWENAKKTSLKCSEKPLKRKKTGFEKSPNQESKWHFGSAQSAFFMTFWPHAPKRDATFS